MARLISLLVCLVLLGANENVSAEGMSLSPLGQQLLEKRLAQEKSKLAAAPSSPTIKRTMDSLREYLDGANYTNVVKVHLDSSFQVHSPFDVDFQQNLPFQPKTQNERLLKFFFAGDRLSKEDQAKLFVGKGQALLKNLKASGLVNDDEYGISLNRISIQPYQTKSKTGSVSPLYIVADVPQSRDAGSGEISTTSNILFGKIESLPPDSVQGVAADFGTGVGIQGLALLKTQPRISKVYGLEIDSHSMGLAKMNAMLNGVEKRFEVLDNSDLALLQKRLGAEKLSFAVSNPPFNIVPEGMENSFSTFGGGGPEGLSVTGLFFQQVKDDMGEGGEFHFYSQLGRNKNGLYNVEKLAKEKLGDGFEVVITECDFASYRMNQNRYAAVWANYADSKLSKKELFRSDETAQLKAKAQASLEKYGIDEVVPAMVKIVRRSGTFAVKREKSADCAGPRMRSAFGPRSDTNGSTAPKTNR